MWVWSKDTAALRRRSFKGLVHLWHAHRQPTISVRPNYPYGPRDETQLLEMEKKLVVVHRLHQILVPFMLRRQASGGSTGGGVRGPGLCAGAAGVWKLIGTSTSSLEWFARKSC